jgi:nucleoside phosphorylase
MQLTQIPQAIVTSLEVNEPLSTGLSAHGLCRVRAATTLGVTVDDGAASRMGHEGFDAEHLEVFAVASACRAARVPFAAVLGVSNRVGSRARDEWREHHHAASANAVQRLVSWLEQGASGLAEAD